MCSIGRQLLPLDLSSICYTLDVMLDSKDRRHHFHLQGSQNLLEEKINSIPSARRQRPQEHKGEIAHRRNWKRLTRSHSPSLRSTPKFAQETKGQDAQGTFQEAQTGNPRSAASLGDL